MRLSNKLLMQGYIMERLKSYPWKFLGGILANNYDIPSPECYMAFWSNMQRPLIGTSHDLVSEFDLITKRFLSNVCNGGGVPTKDA